MRCLYSDYRTLFERVEHARMGWGYSIMTNSIPSSGSRGQGLVTASDGLPALSVPEHVKEKEFAIARMIGIFNSGMQNKWSQRYYVELFSGPGRCVIKESGEEVDGSPILAAKSKAKFTNYFLADISPDLLEVLRKRIAGLGLKELESLLYYPGDADTAVGKLTADLPEARTSLGLAVLDPWGWDFSFKTLATLTAGRRLDLVINFPTVFIKRNWRRDLPQLDRYMNGRGYRKAFESAMIREDPGITPTRVLLDAYEKELKGIGYKYVRDQVGVRNSTGLPLYHLIFASRHERGSEFWDKVTSRQESGQIRMNLNA